LLPVYESLAFRHQVTVFFYNPNIHPVREFLLREGEVRRIASQFSIRLIRGPYKPRSWFQRIQGLENEVEGGRRCTECFAMRLEMSCREAVAKGFEALATTLSSSRHKPGQLIDRIGTELAKKNGLSYVPLAETALDADKHGREMCRELKVFRQNYCGCLYSRPAGFEKKKNKGPLSVT